MKRMGFSLMLFSLMFLGIGNNVAQKTKHEKQNLTKEQMNVIFSQYVTSSKDVSNPCYRVGLSKKDALRMGITAEEYQKNVEYIQTMNDTMSAQKNRGYIFVLSGDSGYIATNK